MTTEQLIAKLSGRGGPAEEAIIASLVARADETLVARLDAELFGAHWPHCVGLANSLARIGGPHALAALQRALRAKRHHTRTAAVAALAAIGDPDVAEAIRPLLADPAYETRLAAKEAILTLTGETVTTARGE